MLNGNQPDDLMYSVKPDSSSLCVSQHICSYDLFEKPSKDFGRIKPCSK